MAPNQSLDIHKLFFQDLANQPVITKAEYIPLLRRIQSKTYFKEIFGDGQEISGLSLWKTTQKYINQLNCLLAEYQIPPISKDEFRQDVEPFVNDPNQNFPSCLGRVLQNPLIPKSQQANITELAWKCFFLITLFPTGSLSFDNFLEIGEFMKQKLLDAEEAWKQLLAGTIRFVTSIAQAHVDEGFPFLDLVQEGLFGLSRATETYREYGGANFQQHSAIWIRQRIGRYISDNRSLIRVPVHRSEALQPVFREAQEFMRVTGEIPNDQKLLSWIQPASTGDVDEEKVEDEGPTQKDQVLLASYKILYYPFWSIESIELGLESESNFPISVEDALVDETDLEFTAAKKQVYDSLHAFLKGNLTERQYQILSLRYGLEDGEAHTLEEIGQMLEVTRERVRQIEAKAKEVLDWKKFNRALSEYAKGGDDRIFPRKRTNSTQRFLYESSQLDHIGYGFELNGYFEKQQLTHLADQYLRRPRGRRGTSQASSLKVNILENALKVIGKPAKYREIYQKAQALLGQALPFSEGDAYRVMFYNNQFRALGKGFFTLTGNEDAECGTINEDGIRVFPECPAPLLPTDASPRAFLESILLVRDALTREVEITAERLYQIMLNWADAKASSPQQAFNAWYAAGIIEWVNFRQNPQQRIQLKLPASFRLSEVRQHCLQSLVERIIKIPELLKAIERMAAPSINHLNHTLYGEESAEYAVSSRLTLLRGLEAVQEENGSWRLTELGRSVLLLYPEIQLPNFQAESEQEFSSNGGEPELELDLFDFV